MQLDERFEFSALLPFSNERPGMTIGAVFPNDQKSGNERATKTGSLSPTATFPMSQ
jgi:hypothetical protein